MGYVSVELNSTYTWPQNKIRERLLEIMESGKLRPGRNVKLFAHELRIRDVAEYIECGYTTLTQIARSQIEMAPDEQLHLTQFLVAWEQGKLVKIKRADQWCIVRATPVKADVRAALGIEVGPHGPQLKRMPPV
jgi:hypothetical protein